MGKESWSNFQMVSKEEDFDVFSFPITQPMPLDHFSSSGFNYTAPIFQDLPIQETAFDAIPLMVNDPFYSLQDFQPNGHNNIVQGDLWGGPIGNGLGAWNHEMSLEFEAHDEMKQPQVLLICDGSDQGELEEKKMKMREEMKGSSSTKTISRETISKCFYMPITKAAKELNVGLTLLKKRCRELGIRRWPHRKLMSLQTLIKNVQEMHNGGGGQMDEKKSRAIKILENQIKLIEEIPDMQMEDQTKRLRQACFKANYKKRKLMGMMMMDSHQSSFQSNFMANSINAAAGSVDSGSWEEELDFGEEDFNYIPSFPDSSSSSNMHYHV